MSFEKVMIFGATIRNMEIENAITQVGKTVAAYVVPNNINFPESVDNIPIKAVGELTEKERDDLIIIPQLSGIQDEVYTFLKYNGFTRIEYYHRMFAALPIKERWYFNQMYNWHINFSVPVSDKPVKDIGSNFKIYIVTSQFNLHKGGGISRKTLAEIF